ncbi:MAG: Signal peptide peptidase SppA, 36K type [Leptospirillum sp. Group IV 'UBA BS']|nr:MAG: Signal peptide peptidase SppA, 36K type [Leptospirillum sp. Group IV 'UBA BS']
MTVNLYPQEKGLEEKVVKPSRAKDKILFLPVRGFIGDQHKKGGLPFLGGKTDQVQLLEREFSKASGDPHVKAVVLMIDSPGGTVTASDRLYHRIRVFRKKTGIPVIAFFGDLGASGAYYAAMGADEVWARPTSVVGSIGVMIANLGFEGLMKKVGVSDRTIASGPEKEMGSPLREMTPEDRKIFEGLVSDFYEKFLDVVEKNRKIGGKKLAVLADGRVYTASQAMSAHLIDHVGYRSDLVDHLKGRLGIAHLKLVRYHRVGGRISSSFRYGGRRMVRTVGRITPFPYQNPWPHPPLFVGPRWTDHEIRGLPQKMVGLSGISLTEQTSPAFCKGGPGLFDSRGGFEGPGLASGLK